MFKVGDIVKVKPHAEYSITVPGTIGIISRVLTSGLFDVTIKEFPETAPSYCRHHVGDTFDLSFSDLELYVNFYGPELPPVNQKIRTMYARQQAKGILRY